MTLADSKLNPLPAEEWPPELDAIRGALGQPLNIHGMMAHHPALLTAWIPIRDHVVGASTLSPRHRELIILRTAHNCRAEYEWLHHVARGLAAGLSEEEVERVKGGPGADGWATDEVALLAAADDCFCDRGLSEGSRSQLAAHFGVAQQLDVLVTVGLYLTLALIINSHDVPME